MELDSGYPYFLLKNGLYRNYDTLRTDLSTEVIVLGGGISGALTAYELIKQDIPCVVIDKRKIACGSTSGSTSLLQYEIDAALHLLAKQIGWLPALQAYDLCAKAIDLIRETADTIGYKGFTSCRSLYFSHKKGRSSYLKEEYAKRKAAGFAVQYLEEQEIFARYGLHSKEAILSEKAGKIDTYEFAHCLHSYSEKKGAKIFENTRVEKITEHAEGITLLIESGHRVEAKKIVYATGYETVEQISRPIASLRSTFALVTEPVVALEPFFKEMVFWNTADPYLYIREDDGRLIIGGRDEKSNDPVKRKKLLNKKAELLLEDVKKLFPAISTQVQFAWAGTFGSTKDGLPYIGSCTGKPHSYYALGFGGNGITFSALAAGLLTRCIKEKENVVPEIFRFNR